MKKILLKSSFIIFIAITLLPYSCRENETPSSGKNIQLVPENVATSIAIHFNPTTFFNLNNSSNNSSFKSPLTGNNKIKEKYLFNDATGTPAVYVFNFENSAGFIFVSADYQMQPILAYFEQGEFKKDNVPAGLISWVDKTMQSIEAVRDGTYDNTRSAAAAWNHYISKSGQGNNLRIPPDDNSCTEDRWVTTTVGPLLPVTWGQGCTYNNLCEDHACSLGCGNGRAWTGCVATAMAQVIRFWQPVNSYSYNYASMPANFGNGEVQRLMRDAGERVGMDYGCDGSGANGSAVPNALKNNFGFTSANFVDYNYSRVQNNLYYHRPVLLDGCRTKTGHWFIINWWNSYSDCHEWVCDGYRESTVSFCMNGQYSGGATYLYFHMNWGWHELPDGFPGYTDYNGWFAFNNWNIAALNRNYQYAQDMTGEIHP